jgi:hypothetical protein
MKHPSQHQQYLLNYNWITILVRTGMYHFEVSLTALYRVRYVLARTSTYHLVLPCTRCTGFQMSKFIPGILPNDSEKICVVYVWNIPDINLNDSEKICKAYYWHIPGMGNGLTYSRYMSEYSRHIDLVVRYMEYSRNMSEYPTSTDSRCRTYDWQEPVKRMMSYFFYYVVCCTYNVV